MDPRFTRDVSRSRAVDMIRRLGTVGSIAASSPALAAALSLPMMTSAALRRTIPMVRTRARTFVLALHRRVMPDQRIPGTLNVGHAPAAIAGDAPAFVAQS